QGSAWDSSFSQHSCWSLAGSPGDAVDGLIGYKRATGAVGHCRAQAPNQAQTSSELTLAPNLGITSRAQFDTRCFHYFVVFSHSLTQFLRAKFQPVIPFAKSFPIQHLHITVHACDKVVFSIQ